MNRRLFAFLLLFPMTALAQKELPLYPKDIPNSKPSPNREKSETDGVVRISKVSKPTLTLFLPPKTAKPVPAVVICPGGGYAILAFDHEGIQEAKAFQAKGIAAVILKYRLPDDSIMLDKSIGPLQDAQQAIRMVRMNAKEWNIDPQKVGIMGFSAGGHLASTAATHFDKTYIENKEKISLRPDFQVLLYPVISFTDTALTHKGSRENLLGKNSSPDQQKLFSNELQITAQSPPAFLVHAADDTVVPVGNSLRYFEQLNNRGIPSGMYVYPKGGHGFGMKNATSRVDWFALMLDWMKDNGFE
ncbi:MAG: alpha/beta hydrolase [Mucilaginibacter polytrichastri]|nr:alpha/beta hydrolase [Mucilaginibacter polytrichastri]